MSWKEGEKPSEQFPPPPGAQLQRLGQEGAEVGERRLHSPERGGGGGRGESGQTPGRRSRVGSTGQAGRAGVWGHGEAGLLAPTTAQLQQWPRAHPRQGPEPCLLQHHHCGGAPPQNPPPAQPSTCPDRRERSQGSPELAAASRVQESGSHHAAPPAPRPLPLPRASRFMVMPAAALPKTQ